MRLFLILALLSTVALSYGQINEELASQKANELLKTVERDLNIVGDKSSSSAQKKAAMKSLRNCFVSSNTYVPNDIDSTASDTSMMKMFAYLTQWMEPSLKNEVAFQFPKMTVEGIYVNKARNAYQIKASVKKRAVFYSLDSVAVEGSDSVKVDTVARKSFSALDVYIFVKKEYDEFKNFKIEAIVRKGQEPKYIKKLSALTQYWIGLDDTWKSIISKRFKFPEVPNDYLLGYIRNVDKLDFSGQEVATFEPLRGLSGLVEFKASKSNFKDLSLLSNCTKLRVLELNNTDLKSTKGIGKLTKLEVFEANECELDTLEEIENCTALIDLELAGNKLKNIDALASLVNLEKLDVSANEITDLRALKYLNKLDNINLAKNKDIEDISVLKNKYQLVKVNIFNTSVASLDALSSLKRITYLNCGYTKITSLDPVKGCVYMIHLNISGNKITDFSALNNYDYIQTLNCATTNITDVSPLMKMQSIQELVAHHTSFTKGDIQRFKKQYPKCRITYY